jgi:hypothetical protein
MPNARRYVFPTVIFGLLLLSTWSIQGCTAIVWLGAVGIDRTLSSDIEFQPFENSWVVGPQERQHLASLKSIAVMPFDGDPIMAARWTAVFRDMTDLRVENPSDATWYGVFDYGQIGPVQRIRVEPQADCVLIGNVVGQALQKSFAGLKERSSQRLHLQLVSASGAILWRTELPYTIVTGAKGLDEGMVTRALLTHVKAQANELGFGEPGAFHKRTVLRSLHDTPNHQMARPVPWFERP